MSYLLRSLPVFAAFPFILGWNHRLAAQELPEAKDSFQIERALADQLVNVFITPDEGPPLTTLTGKKIGSINGTVRKEAAATLLKMGSPAIGPIWERLNDAWNRKDFVSTKDLAMLLGHFGYPLSRTPWKKNKVKDDVRKTLIAIASSHETFPGGETTEARQAAIEALGKIYSQRAAFLILERPEIFRSPGDARALAKRLRDQTQNIKARFVRDEKDLEAQLLDPPDPSTVAALLLDARNLQRIFQESNDRKLFLLLGELEPAGKDKSLQERTDLLFVDLENHLRAVATTPAKDSDKARREAWLKANRSAHDLSEEIETLYVYILPRWEDERNALQEVLAAFEQIMRDEASRLYDRQFLIRLSVGQATRRIYVGEK